MKLCHTAQIALSLNVRIIDDAGRPVAAYISPVVYLWTWLPATLWAWLVTITTKRHKPAVTHWLLDLCGWRADLPVIARAGWLLVRDRRICYD